MISRFITSSLLWTRGIKVFSSTSPTQYQLTKPLSPSQAKAVTDTGVQLILAGPGSGKTGVITEKILHLINHGVKPDNILALTFSDKAAKEMLDRLERTTRTSDLTVSTFHSFALSVLEDNVLESGLSFSQGIISQLTKHLL